ncbi:MAG: 30S ribosomal protein S7, partial [Candidatus Thorarchaeota archaeon]
MSKTKKDVKFFNKWSFENIEIGDPTLENYINLKPIIVPHSAGRHEHRRFWKSSKVSIIERFTNRLLSPGFIGSRIKGHKSSYNSGKKAKLLRSIKDAFTLIELLTGENPIQVLIDG